MLAWRVTKVKYEPFDGSGAQRVGGRWNSPGRPVIYAADSFAGALLEILAHAVRPRTLPGAHHAVRIEVPDDLVELVDPERVPRWFEPESGAAREWGDSWLTEARSVALSVPSLASRPVGRVVLINPRHPELGQVSRGRRFRVPWDERLL